MPEGEGFVGCIKNLTFSASGKNVIYDLGSPADGENFTPGKNYFNILFFYYSERYLIFYSAPFDHLYFFYFNLKPSLTYHLVFIQRILGCKCSLP